MTSVNGAGRVDTGFRRGSYEMKLKPFSHEGRNHSENNPRTG